MKSRRVLFVVVLLTLLSLTGCGEKKKYEAAVELEKEGKYFEAYQAYSEISKYEDAESKAKEMESAVINEAKQAFASGRFADAKALAEHFSLRHGEMKDIVLFAGNAMQGTYLENLSVSEDGLLSFDAYLTDWTDTLKITLEASNQFLQGKVTASVIPDDAEEPRWEIFSAEYFFTGDHYAVKDVPLDSWGYDCEDRKLTLIDVNILASNTLNRLHMLSLVGIPFDYKAILNDGREGAGMMSFTGLQFKNVIDAFAGGKVTVHIVSEDGKLERFQMSTAIPGGDS